MSATVMLHNLIAPSVNSLNDRSPAVVLDTETEDGVDVHVFFENSQEAITWLEAAAKAARKG